MGIVRQQPMAGLYGKAAKLMGQAEAAKKEQAYARQATAQLEQIQLQKEMDEFQFNIEKERMKLQETYKIAADQRAYEWELEKAEIASRNDFERQERQRSIKLDELDAKIKAIESSDLLADDPQRKERLIWFEKYKTLGGNVTWRDVFGEEEDLLGSYISKAMGGGQPQAASQPMPAQQTYKIGQIITSASGERAQITGYNSQGVPTIKRL